MKHELPEPAWQYATTDDHLFQIDQLQLILWSKGLCIAGYGTHGKVLTGKGFTWDKAWDIASIESVLDNESLIAGPQPVTHVWIAEERQLIVPQPLFEPDAAENWLRDFHFIEPGETVLKDIGKHSFKANIIFPLPNNCLNVLKKYFDRIHIKSLSTALLASPAPEQEDSIQVACLGQLALLSIYQKGELQSHQAFSFQAAEDVFYKIGCIALESALKLPGINAELSGVPSFALSEDWPVYYPKAKRQDHQQSLFDLLHKTFACVS